jgi:hypothetical protein
MGTACRAHMVWRGCEDDKVLIIFYKSSKFMVLDDTNLFIRYYLVHRGIFMYKIVILSFFFMTSISITAICLKCERAPKKEGIHFLTQDQKDTLATFKLIDTIDNSENPRVKARLYEMTYKADYAFDKYLKFGSRNYKELGSFLYENVYHQKAVNNETPQLKHGCTSFSARNSERHVIVGRNFDLKYSMSVSIMMLRTKPAGGYASVTFVYIPHLSYMGSTDELFAPYRPYLGSTNNLIAPYIPMDGMNEVGVVVSTLDAADANILSSNQDPKKVTIWHPCRMRLILDYAKNVDEAITLLGKYNTFFTEDDKDHIMITDRSGDSVVIEYHSGKMKAIRSGKPWQVVSNYTLDGKNPEDLSNCERYKIAWASLKNKKGVITNAEAMSLLVNISLLDKSMDTFWSAVYDLQSGNIQLVCVSNEEKMKTFHLDMLP